MDMPEALSKKIGPLPAGAWILALGGGVAVAYFVRKGAHEAEAVDATIEAAEAAAEQTGPSGWEQDGDTSTNPGSGGGSYQDWYDGADDADDYDGGDLADDPYPIGPTGPVGPTGQDGAAGRPGQLAGLGTIRAARQAKRNKGWRTNTAKALEARGYRGGLVDRALGDFLDGKRLNDAERNIVTQAIGIAGAPPKAPDRKPEPKREPKRDDRPKAPDRRDNGREDQPKKRNRR